MTHHLAALRLRAIGDPSARFTDLTLDTTSPLESSHVPDDTVVWLRNGGGKSSLLSLFYALLLPREQDFMSRSLKRYLTDYVRTGDTSHTVAVWHPAARTSLLGDPEQVLVTGAVYEWADQHRPVDAEKARDRLNRHYYAFYAIPGVLDESNLPFEDGVGRPLRLGAFLTVLKELAVNDVARLNLVVTDKQYKWTEELTNRGLDPDIFRTQKTMNHVEGGVEDLFKFPTTRHFIDFLLELTVPPGSATSVAGRLSDIADVLARKPAKMEERDFCDATANALDRVAHAHAEVVTATDDLVEAQKFGAAVAASFAAVIAAATVDRDGLGPRRDEVETRRSRSSGEAVQGYVLAYLYQVRAAELRLAAAQETLRLLEGNAASASALVDAWKLTEHLGARADLTSELAQVLAESTAERAALEPQRAEHDQHGTRLAARLESLSVAAEVLARDEQGEAARLALKARVHEGNAAAARKNQRIAERDTGSAQAKMDELAKDVHRAVQAGHLPSESTEPAAHHEHLLKSGADLQVAVEGIREARKTRARQQKEHNQTLTELTTRQSQLDSERSQRATQIDGLQNRANALTGSARVRDLTEATDDAPVDIWGEAGTVRDRLTREVIGADSALIRLAAAQIDSQRVRDTHTRTGFLPTSVDAERVAATLAEGGIPSEPGWSHLRTLLSDATLTARLDDPATARVGCGVVIPTEREQDARQTLAAMDTVTISLVGVYTAQAASELTGSVQVASLPTDPTWTGLDRGMVNKSVAESVVNVLDLADQDFSRQEHELATQRDTDRVLLQQLDVFLGECPEGHLDTLTSTLDAVDQSLTDLAVNLAEISATLTSLEEAENVDSAAEKELTGQIGLNQITLSRLAALVEKAADATGWKRQRDDAVTAAAEAEALDDVETSKAQAATNAAHRHTKQADTADRDVSTYRIEKAGIGFLDGRTDPTPDDPTVTLHGLQVRFAHAQRAWEAQASTSVLAERESNLRARLAPQEQVISAADHKRLTHAGELLASPSGQSPQGRALALAAAERDKNDTTKAEGRAQGAVTSAETHLSAAKARRADPTRRQLPVEPETAEAADALAAEQERAGTKARAAETEAEAELVAINAEKDRLDRRANFFEVLNDGLPEPSPATTDPFTGEDDAARTQRREAMTRLSTSIQRRTKAGETMTEAMTGLRATAARYPNVTTQARDRAAHDHQETIAPNAADMAVQLRLRLNMITGELEAVAKDQDIVTESLVNLVKDTLDTLRKADRYSRLPASMGAWANKHMLKINFDNPANDTDLRAHINLVIDKRVAAGVKAEGLPLLKEAVHAAVGLRGFTVTVLKPTQDLNVTREDITRLGKWSGGEKLTVCVALYCTIAALRAANNGRRDHSGGVLLLDNPTGRASHGSLVWLQRSVAKAHGVQLIFTTGVKDPDAVSQFPNIVRLDNRAGRTQGRRYVIPGDPDMDDRNEDPVLSLVSGTRIGHTEHGAGEPA